MKLTELFTTQDERRLVRRSSWEYWQPSVTLKSLSDIRTWLHLAEGNRDAQIAPHYIEDNSADDWEVIL